MYVYRVYAWCKQMSKGCWIPLELELQVVVSHSIGCENQIWVSGRAANALKL